LISALVALSSPHPSGAEPSDSPTPTKTLIVSDIDDTLKESFSGCWTSKLARAWRVDLQVPEMPAVLQRLQQVLSARLAYVSAGPEFLMGCSHREFLRLNGFPDGEVHMRTSLATIKDFKIARIGGLIDQLRPDRVVLIGDNRKLDEFIYDAVRRRFGAIRFDIFIRDARWIQDGLVAARNMDLVYFVDGRQILTDLGATGEGFRVCAGIFDR
jgi:phosphatidate phosphatase APP1